MAAVWYRFRAELHTRWRAWLGLALLIGVASGVVMALAAGARRTDSAYSRFLVTQRAYDVGVLLPPGEPGLAHVDPEEITRLPQVDEAARARVHQLGEVGGLAGADGRLGTEINRFKILEGRAADPDRLDEAVVGFEFAHEGHFEVGERISIVDPEVRESCETATPLPDLDPPEAAFVARCRRILAAVPNGRVTIVGIEASPGEFPPQLGGGFLPPVHLTPAFDRRVGGGPDTALLDVEVVFARLGRGADDVPSFQRDVERLGEGGFFQQVVQRDQAANVQRSIHLQTVALRLLAGLTALTAALVLGQLLARSALLESSDHPALDALGMARSQRLACGLLRATGVGAIAAAVAAGLAITASPLFPTGLARAAEPHPGLAVDALVLVLGAATVALLVPLLTALPAWRAARVSRDLPARLGGRGRPSRLAGALAGGGLALPAVTGVRMAVEPGRGRAAVPVRSSIACVTLGVVTVVVALTFGASLSHLLDTPRLYGVRWDLQYTAFDDGVDLGGDAPAVLRSSGGVEAAAVGFYGLALDVDGTRADAAVLNPLVGDALPPVLDGRHPEAPDEILLGARTMEKLALRIGDRVTVRSQGGGTGSARVVGKGVLPSFSDAGRLGEGSLITLGAARRLDPAILEVDAPSLFLRLDGRVSGKTISAALDRELQIQESQTVGAGRTPTDIVNFGRVERMPFVLAGILAVLAAGALAHVLASAIRRRRRDLALLKTLGFVRRQVALVVAWQASVVTLVALAIGVPLGIVVGRTVWRLFADDLGVVAVPRVPLLAVAVVTPAALLVANVVAAIPAWMAARTRPAVVLRAE